MTRKQIIWIVALVLVVSALSASVAYHYGRRGYVGPFGTPSSVSLAEGGKCVDFREAGSQVGKQGCVTGLVLKVYTSRAGHTFLDFCPDYRQCSFTSVVFASDRSKFGDMSTLTGREIEIRGPITTYQDRAEIVIRDPGQLRVRP